MPCALAVLALNCFTNSMMLTPCGPRAVPTGGAGVAAPACSCTLTSAAIFFLGGIPQSLSSRGHDEEYDVRLCHFPAPVSRPVLRFGGSDLLDLVEAQL